MRTRRQSWIRKKKSIKLRALIQEYYRVRTAYCCADYLKPGSCERTDCIFVHKHQLLVAHDGGTTLPAYPHVPAVVAEVARANVSSRQGLLQHAFRHDYELS